MKKICVALMTLGVVAAGVPAAAATMSPDDQAIVYKAGRCLVEKDRGAAVSALDTLPLEGGEVAPGSIKDSAGCLSGGLPANSALPLRGAIAQALFFDDFEEFGMAPNRRTSDMVELKLPISDAAAGLDAKTIALYKIGDCVARNDMERTEKLLRTDPGSSREMNFYSKMQPLMNACQAQDATTSMSRGELRSVLAQSFYHAAARYYTGQLKHANVR